MRNNVDEQKQIIIGAIQSQENRCTFSLRQNDADHGRLHRAELDRKARALEFAGKDCRDPCKISGCPFSDTTEETRMAAHNLLLKNSLTGCIMKAHDRTRCSAKIRFMNPQTQVKEQLSSTRVLTISHRRIHCIRTQNLVSRDSTSFSIEC